MITNNIFLIVYTKIPIVQFKKLSFGHAIYFFFFYFKYMFTSSIGEKVRRFFLWLLEYFVCKFVCMSFSHYLFNNIILCLLLTLSIVISTNNRNSRRRSGEGGAGTYSNYLYNHYQKFNVIFFCCCCP